jgi:hypothetical protein
MSGEFQVAGDQFLYGWLVFHNQYCCCHAHSNGLFYPPHIMNLLLQPYDSAGARLRKPLVQKQFS